jgi:hypothetical protein
MVSKRTHRHSYTIGLRAAGVFAAAALMLGAQSPQATPDLPASIQGTIKSAEGAPVEGALLAAIPLGLDPNQFTDLRPASITHSDREGHFRLMNLKAGG